ncbi:mediator of RNA polymerase II transcription subunit 17 [Spathaspora passalidarum NRRL Y-27907]|uniref:Mediator of RNA polymerase II transcription subunit 17 n=1 Tax=Spathaspora passalidarum (strain NRRL Y-27907 / 11-Y1) TaxID=619300 RepID=G3AFD3_SPAPN|nr:mediator of RNA polymerase II transcription subunit 17 [Spathaspora passalidarum NRRL Y-27907]EGW34921.1 mediator of RNA polymerase II transcription subunit 17 [Spathaspora passalidarum NRRL Y-27907]
MSNGGGFHIDLNLDQYTEVNKDPFIQNEDKLNLEELIPRILLERKSFINVTEDSLKKEIEKSSLGIDKEEEELLSTEGTDQDEQTDPQEAFNKHKLELSKNINSALNETSLSLDFVSLLMASVKPNLAKSTMSPHLTKFVKPGSLNSDRLSTADTNEISAKRDTNSSKIGQGWKLESLNKVTSLFRQSSLNLNEQVLKERRYWNMINLVLANDEVLFRIRDPLNNARAIGVMYGYGDSGSNFHDKGMALLRKDNQTGEISFHPIATYSNKIVQKVYKYVRIRILSEIDGDYMLTGQSIFQYDFTKSKTNIINDIERARFFLFEEDLFYQLTREGKMLINYNVSIISNKIIIEINKEIIEIESVVYDELNEEELSNYYQNINAYSSINNTKCQLILNYLKLMLCCYYKYNLKLKQKIPTSLTKWKQFNSHPLILRPLLGNMRHELNLKNMNDILNRILTKHKTYKLELQKFVNLQNKSKNPFQKSIEKPVSEFHVLVKNAKSNILKIKLELTTNEIFVNLIINLTIIRFENESDFENKINGTNVLQINFNDFNEIDECLDWSIQNFVNS